ncbi:NTPase [Pochonia chlamydosporia 170]|uniref:inosine/xanthosine triphosphatase n=1 Tax=Pochonia chlamydosporia 170 TaxID=1380566 RepID=A0A179FB08_METCM|nr:NTPase [Pochonia chlamydosporia 170]OAQ62652.1 NTPase [Pochonia chlamydosporia 170]
MAAAAVSAKVVVVASKNPVKIGAARDGFARMFPTLTFDVRATSVPSGVPDQPFTDEETLQGALNRARNARDVEPNADYWIGLEGGVDGGEADDGPIQSFAWIVVVGKGKDGDGNGERVGKARTSTYYLPEETAKLLRDGMELGHADDLVHGRTNSKHKSGSVGILTDDVVNRQSYYSEAVVLALIPFKNVRLTF